MAIPVIRIFIELYIAIICIHRDSALTNKSEFPRSPIAWLS